jgi:hypothetical protein
LKSIVEKIGARARILGLPGDPDMLGGDVPVIVEIGGAALLTLSL